MRDGYRVIDVDSHVSPSMEVLQKLAGDGIKSRINQRSGTLPYPEYQYVQNYLTTYSHGTLIFVALPISSAIKDMKALLHNA